MRHARPAPRRTGRLLVAASLVAFVARGGAEAADGPSVTRSAHAAHLVRMLRAEELKQALLEAADSDAVSVVLRDARSLRPILTAEHTYWVAAGDNRAITFSARNRQSLDGLIEAARRGDADATYNATLSLAETCAACHDNHPERRVRVRR